MWKQLTLKDKDLIAQSVKVVSDFYYPDIITQDHIEANMTNKGDNYRSFFYDDGVGQMSFGLHFTTGNQMWKVIDVAYAGKFDDPVLFFTQSFRQQLDSLGIVDFYCYLKGGFTKPESIQFIKECCEKMWETVFKREIEGGIIMIRFKRDLTLKPADEAVYALQIKTQPLVQIPPRVPMTETEIQEVVDFILQHMPYKRRIVEAVVRERERLQLHTVLRDDKGIYAVSSWSMIYDTAEIHDVIIRSDMRNNGTLCELVRLGVEAYPYAKFISFRRGMKPIPDFTDRTYDITEFTRRSL